MYDSLGYETTMNFNMFFQLFVLLFFFRFNCGFGVFESQGRRNVELAKMKEIKLAVQCVRKSGDPEI